MGTSQTVPNPLSQPLPTAAAQPHAAPTAGTRPVGVAVIAVLQMIFASLFLLAGFAFLVGGAVISETLAESLPGFWGRLATAGVVAFGVLFLLIGGLVLTLAIGNMMGKGWAWTLMIVWAIINIAFQLIGLLGADAEGLGGVLFSLLFNGFIVWYYFTPGVKAFFGKGQHCAFWQRPRAA